MNSVRRIVLPHIHNLRDLGGYPINEETMTAWNRCYRCDDLYALEASEWKFLKELKISCILDLRSAQEQAASSYDSEQYGIQHISIPFMKEMVQANQAMDDDALHNFIASMKLDYVQMFKDAGDHVKEALTAIASTLEKGEALIFHCSAGKDRTGILACILLALCGVDKLDILADYQVSATYNTNGVNQRLPQAIMDMENVREMFESRPDMMEPLVDYLLETSCKEVLVKQGIQEETLDCICKYMISDM